MKSDKSLFKEDNSQILTLDESIKLLRQGRRRGVGEWNRFVKLGAEIPPLQRINLNGKSLDRINFSGINLRKAKLNQAEFRHAKFCGADLREASFRGSNLNDADFSGANLEDVNLRETSLVRTNLENANLTGCKVYGISAWGINLKGATQSNLIVSPRGEPIITVDNLEIAQFIYLMLNNDKIRHVINAITSKAVLILGRFTPPRKSILDGIRDRLRTLDYLPILFDFEIPERRDITETVTLLARMSRFIIADLSEPSSIPKELEAIVPSMAIPVQPIIKSIEKPYSMFKDYWKYDWVLHTHRYNNLDDLLSELQDKVIIPCEKKVKELEERKRIIYG